MVYDKFRQFIVNRRMPNGTYGRVKGRWGKQSPSSYSFKSKATSSILK